jgi:uncharacterized protein (TIGR02145 family)
MTQNLRSTSGLTANANSGNSNSAYYYYPHAETGILTSHSEYGLLYTWFAASGRTSSSDEGNTSHGPHQGICPSGWHLPSDLEWTQLTDVISASADGAYSITTGTGNVGTKMKSATPVNSLATNGTSKSRTANGFYGLLVGFMYDGSPSLYGTYTAFWSSSSAGSAYGTALAWSRTLDSSSTATSYFEEDKSAMLSVRCKKNE